MSRRVLIIAGSDSGGGAGVQADIKTVTMLGEHAMTAITAVTAQNTLGVSAVHPIPTETVVAQIDAVLDDIGADAVKIGMIGSAETANAVADRLEQIAVPIVFDPVMVASSGAALADAETIAAFARLMAVATVTTPNVPELEALSGKPIADSIALHAAAIGLASGGSAVLAKGGHLPGDLVEDLLITGGGEHRWSATRIDSPHSHGTGCTLASAIAVGLAEHLPLAAAVDRARRFVRIAMFDAPGLGQGHGPMGQQSVRLDVGAGARLNQVTLPATDYAASIAFYRELGLTQIVDSPGHYARFEAAGGATLSIHIEDDERLGSTTLYFELDDLDGFVAALKANGVALDHGPVDQEWQWREARLRDPFGNRICLYQAGEIRRYPPWRIES